MRALLKIWLFSAVLCVTFALQVSASERQFRLSAPAELIESGVLKHLLPRFSLKTQVRIELVEPGETSVVSFGAEGTPVFNGLGRNWAVQLNNPDHAGARRFVDWLRSDVGQRTITSFTVDGASPFTLPQAEAQVVATVSFDGDAEAGQVLSLQMCGRCHVVSDTNRMNAIGSTPSFFALRTLSDWDERFTAFYALNPHPSFTQVAEITPPFADERPSPIVPIEITLADLEAILAYVALLEPANLGAPLQHQ